GGVHDIFVFFQAEDCIRVGHMTGVQTCALPISRRAAEVVRLHGRERPAVAGEFARDGDRDDRAPLAAPLEGVPALVEPACAAVGLRAYRGGLSLAASREGRALAQRLPLVPGGLH